jgi:hypothetical protein
MNILQRVAAPTPSFFKKLQLFGLILTAAAGVVIGGGQTAPRQLIEVAKHIATAGAVLIAVSQVTVDDKQIGGGSQPRSENRN